jgi:hypothetical protein
MPKSPNLVISIQSGAPKVGSYNENEEPEAGSNPVQETVPQSIQDEFKKKVDLFVSEKGYETEDACEIATELINEKTGASYTVEQLCQAVGLKSEEDTSDEKGSNASEVEPSKG